MACNGQYATARDYVELICTRTADVQDEPHINVLLTRVAGTITAALQANGQCDCTWASWVDDYLANLNVYLAAALQDCPCSNLTEEDKRRYLDYVNNELEMIRTGRTELCEGETGVDYPAFGNVNIGHNIFSRADIIQKREQRNDV